MQAVVLSHSPVVWPWTGKLISESLSFCLCKVWIMMLICSSCLEDDERHLHSPQCPAPSRCSINVSYKEHPPRRGIPLYSAGRRWPHHYRPDPALRALSHHTWEKRALFSNTPPSAFFFLPSRNSSPYGGLFSWGSALFHLKLVPKRDSPTPSFQSHLLKPVLETSVFQQITPLYPYIMKNAGFFW